jgi:hypothetical protein
MQVNVTFRMRIIYQQTLKSNLTFETHKTHTEDNKKKKNFVRYYEEIINCDYIKIAKLCGTEAAHLMFTLAKKIFNAVIEVKDCVCGMYLNNL